MLIPLALVLLFGAPLSPETAAQDEIALPGSVSLTNSRVGGGGIRIISRDPAAVAAAISSGNAWSVVDAGGTDAEILAAFAEKTRLEPRLASIFVIEPGDQVERTANADGSETIAIIHSDGLHGATSTRRGDTTTTTYEFLPR